MLVKPVFEIEAIGVKPFIILCDNHIGLLEHLLLVLVNRGVAYQKVLKLKQD